MNKRWMVLLAPVAVVALSASTCDKDDAARKKDEKISNQLLVDLKRAHPVPNFKRSQLRQNLVELITAQAKTTQTTSFFFNQGVVDPMHSCPSIGFPIPATAQLTNPEQKVSDGAVLPQVEPTGVFTGDTSGTYVICIDARGKAYASYWEGFVHTVSGPASWNSETKRVELVGPSSVEFTAK